MINPRAASASASGTPSTDGMSTSSPFTELEEELPPPAASRVASGSCGRLRQQRSATEPPSTQLLHRCFAAMLRCVPTVSSVQVKPGGSSTPVAMSSARTRRIDSYSMTRPLLVAMSSFDLLGVGASRGELICDKMYRSQQKQIVRAPALQVLLHRLSCQERPAGCVRNVPERRSGG